MGMTEILSTIFLAGIFVWFLHIKKISDKKWDRYAIEELERLREKVKNEP